MTVLILGLILFLGPHSVRIVAEPWRTQMLQRLGEKPWKGLYSLVSLIGFALIIWGYGLTRYDPVVLWQPPVAMRHIASLLTLASFILLTAAYVPGNSIKARLRHPMILGVKLWAFAHLLANGMAADLVLFGAFLLWAVLDYRAARERDREQSISYGQGKLVPGIVAVVIGTLLWAAFAFWLHRWWIGVAPFGG